jgi:hypothetical protein
MSMGRHQTGSLRQLPSGRIQVRYTGPDGRRRAPPQTFPKRALARRWLALTEADMSVNLGRLGAATAAAVCIRCREPLSYDDGTHIHPTCGA